MKVLENQNVSTIPSLNFRIGSFTVLGLSSMLYYTDRHDTSALCGIPRFVY